MQHRLFVADCRHWWVDDPENWSTPNGNNNAACRSFHLFFHEECHHKVFGCGTFTSLSQFFKTSLSTSKLARLEYLLLDNCKNLNAYSAIQVVKLSSKLKMLSLNGLALSPDNVQVIAHLELSMLFSIGLTGAVLSVETAEIFYQNHSIFSRDSIRETKT